MPAKLEPWQVIANSLQVSGPQAHRQRATETLGAKYSIPDLQSWARECVRMLEAYGYKITHQEKAT